jgi:hypothetical protein
MPGPDTPRHPPWRLWLQGPNWHGDSRGFLLKRILLIAGLPLFAIFPAHLSADAVGYTLSQCAVVQPGASPRLYLCLPSGELEAEDVLTGKTLWRSSKAAFPLLARNERLLALLAADPHDDGWRMAVLDADTGKILFEYPGWGKEAQAGGAVGEGMGTSTRVEGFSQGGLDYVAWRSASSDVSPVNHPARPVRVVSGTARVDLFQGTLIPVEGQPPRHGIHFSSNRRGGEQSEPFEIEGVTVTASRELEKGKWKLLMRRSRDAEGLPRVVISQAPWQFCGVAVTADRRHVLGIFNAPGKSGSAGGYDVTMCSTATGRKTGHLVTDSWPSSSVILKDKLIYFFPDQVKVVDIPSGKKSFSWPLRNLMYHGSYPPSPGHPAAPRASIPDK